MILGTVILEPPTSKLEQIIRQNSVVEEFVVTNVVKEDIEGGEVIIQRFINFIKSLCLTKLLGRNLWRRYLVRTSVEEWIRCSDSVSFWKKHLNIAVENTKVQVKSMTTFWNIFEFFKSLENFHLCNHPYFWYTSFQ